MTAWEFGEDNDGWYAGPPGEQRCYCCSEEDAERIAESVNRMRKIEAMLCEGVDMGRYHEVPAEAWEELTDAVFRGNPRLNRR